MTSNICQDQINTPSRSNPSPFAINNVRLFIWFSVFFHARFYYPVFTILFLDFGLTLEQFSILNAVWAATIVVFEVPSGALADTFGRRNLLVCSGALMILEIALLCIVPHGKSDLLFAVFLVNRVLSGAAEAAASGADEALAYDSLAQAGMADTWRYVLERRIRAQSIAFILAMSIGAAVYDPDFINILCEWLEWGALFSQQTTIRFPLYLTFIMALLAFWTSLRMREINPPSEIMSAAECESDKHCVTSMRHAFYLTLNAGVWILKTPAALIIIAAGLAFDHIIRMVMTLSSQYYRLILLPEATFGLIGAGLALLGLIVPRYAAKMVERYSPQFNLTMISAMTLIGLGMMALSLPVIGLIPIIILTSVMYMAGLFISHYLNRITDSHQRATVLSFKGLSFNLAYGAFGLLYSFLLALLRSDYMLRVTPTIPGKSIEVNIFSMSLKWFPGYFLLLLSIGYICFRHYRKHVEPSAFHSLDPET